MGTVFQGRCLPGSVPTVGKFKTWLQRAQDRDRFVYHVGTVASGTNHIGEVLAPAERQLLAEVANCAWVAAQQGHVHLLQRRLWDNCFEYFAVARPQPAEPSA